MHKEPELADPLSARSHREYGESERQLQNKFSPVASALEPGSRNDDSQGIYNLVEKSKQNERKEKKEGRKDGTKESCSSKNFINRNRGQAQKERKKEGKMGTL